MYAGGGCDPSTVAAFASPSYYYLAVSLTATRAVMNDLYLIKR